ncbi:hypothetical protein GCM10022240_25000 [Microbacterium kribbense]|uniref:AbiEi antitoxin C-terminal domain-containing protein n=1 Tax=Microbacterium kribbense TaxID=433645 RepID=A0ABP7GQA0_9MICO
MTSPYLYFPGGRLSSAELTAACLDGHLVALGEGYIPADAVETAALRAASLRELLPPGVAATHRSAAWIHGAPAAPPARHRVQRVSARRLHHRIDRRLQFHDTRMPPADVVRIGGVLVTTPIRTLVDLTRTAGPGHRRAALLMVQAGIADAEDAIAWLHASPGLPGKRTALPLLQAWASADQPEVTR